MQDVFSIGKVYGIEFDGFMYLNMCWFVYVERFKGRYMVWGIRYGCRCVGMDYRYIYVCMCLVFV